MSPRQHRCEPAVEWTVLPIESALRAGLPTVLVRRAGACSARRRRATSPGSVWGRPMLLAAEGDHSGALDQYDSVLAHDEPGLPVSLHASLLLASARCHLVLGERPVAVALATEARGLLDHWPGYRRDEVDAFLRRATRPGPADAGDGGGELTAREREVARPRGARVSPTRPWPERALHLAADRRRPRVEHPRQARVGEPLRARPRGRSAPGWASPDRH